jgi:hypothetical protein
MIEECPHCGKALKLAHHHAEVNVLAYGGAATTATTCCGNMVRHRRIEYAVVEKARMPADREDDWGYVAVPNEAAT